MNRPIGYWVKRLDAALESQFETTLTRLRLNRRQWAVIGLLSSGPASPADVKEVLHPFNGAGRGDRQEQDMAMLVSRNLVTLLDGNLTLTVAGRALHAEALGSVEDTRRELTVGIGTDEFAMALSVLERMSHNADRLAAR